MWVKCDDGTYWNTQTHERVWELPRDVETDWKCVRTSYDETYYHNVRTNETSWAQPQDSNQPAVACSEKGVRLPAASQTTKVIGVDRALRSYRRQHGEWAFMNVYTGPDVPLIRACGSSSSPCALATCWVEVETRERRRYFWDALGMSSSGYLPKDATVEWRAFEVDPGGKYYYQNVKTLKTTWLPPGMTSPRCRLADLAFDQPVRLRDGVGARYAGQIGEIAVLYPDGHPYHEMVGVKMSDVLGDEIVVVHCTYLDHLAEGDLVELRGESRVGTVCGQHDGSQNLTVCLENGERIRRSATSLLPRCRLWGIHLKGVLQWEETCLFVGNDGFHQTYKLHLPEGLDRSQPCDPWPLLVYMHGSGGGSILERTCSSKDSSGLRFASSSFVVVVPSCRWKWKQRPEMWVKELVIQLRAASWIDPKRIYLTGCSMGGMGTLEIAAESPEIFAAIAPVAAYHQPERTDVIVRGLQSTAILAVHSSYDESCSCRLQEDLWNRLVAAGNRRLQVACAPKFSHNDMERRAYHEHSTLYTWLLRHRLD